MRCNADPELNNVSDFGDCAYGRKRVSVGATETFLSMTGRETSVEAAVKEWLNRYREAANYYWMSTGGSNMALSVAGTGAAGRASESAWRASGANRAYDQKQMHRGQSQWQVMLR